MNSRIKYSGILISMDIQDTAYVYYCIPLAALSCTSLLASLFSSILCTAVQPLLSDIRLLTPFAPTPAGHWIAGLGGTTVTWNEVSFSLWCAPLVFTKRKSVSSDVTDSSRRACRLVWMITIFGIPAGILLLVGWMGSIPAGIPEISERSTNEIQARMGFGGPAAAEGDDSFLISVRINNVCGFETFKELRSIQPRSSASNVMWHW